MRRQATAPRTGADPRAHLPDGWWPRDLHGRSPWTRPRPAWPYGRKLLPSRKWFPAAHPRCIGQRYPNQLSTLSTAVVKTAVNVCSVQPCTPAEVTSCGTPRGRRNRRT